MPTPEATRVRTHTESLTPALRRCSPWSERSYPISAWGLPALSAFILAIYILRISALPSKLMLPFALAALCGFVAVIVGNPRKLLLAIILLDIPIQLDINLFYEEEAAAIGALGGLNLSVTTVSLAALYGLWFAQIVTRRSSIPKHLLRATLPFVTYFGFVVFSLLTAHSISLSLFEIGLLFQTLLLFIYIVGTTRTREDIYFIVTLLLIGVILLSLSMIAAYATGQEITFGPISTRVDPSFTRGTFFRPGGTIGSPLTAASHLALLLVPAVSILLARLRWYHTVLAAMSFCLGLIALVMTYSRSGWIAFFVAGVVFCVILWHRGWLSLRIPVFFVLAVLVLSLPFYATIYTRLTGDDSGSAYSRIPHAKLALRIIADTPIFGVGANNVGLVMTGYAREGFQDLWLYTPHNKYLLVWTETGIGGMLAFTWFLLATLARGWRCWRLRDPVISPLALAFTTGMLGQMVHMLTDMFHNRPQVQLLWLTAALIVAINHAAVIKATDKPLTPATGQQQFSGSPGSRRLTSIS